LTKNNKKAIIIIEEKYILMRSYYVKNCKV